MSYKDFAKYYDILTDNVDYNNIAYYYKEILHKYGIENGKLLDLGCGTGSLAIRMEILGFSNITGFDLSSNMLETAKEKSQTVNWVCGDMRALPFDGDFDCVISALDSINHLKNKEAVKQTFDSVYKSLKKDGIFAADLNTPYKHQYILSDNVYTFDYEDEGLYCVWENERVQNDSLNRIEMCLEFFERQRDGNYKRSSDSLSEIALSPEEITQMLIKSGFKMLECKEYLTGAKIKKNSDKFTVIAKK